MKDSKPKKSPQATPGDKSASPPSAADREALREMSYPEQLAATTPPDGPTPIGDAPGYPLVASKGGETPSLDAVVGTVTPDSTEGSCNAKTGSAQQRIFDNSNGAIRADRYYNNRHYYLQVGDVMICPTMAQFVGANGKPSSEVPAIVARGTEAQMRAQLAALVAAHGIRHTSSKDDNGSPLVPKHITTADALFDWAYGGAKLSTSGATLKPKSTEKHTEGRESGLGDGGADPWAAKPAASADDGVVGQTADGTPVFGKGHKDHTPPTSKWMDKGGRWHWPGDEVPAYKPPAARADDGIIGQTADGEPVYAKGHKNHKPPTGKWMDKGGQWFWPDDPFPDAKPAGAADDESLSKPPGPVPDADDGGRAKPPGPSPNDAATDAPKLAAKPADGVVGHTRYNEPVYAPDHPKYSKPTSPWLDSHGNWWSSDGEMLRSRGAARVKDARSRLAATEEGQKALKVIDDNKIAVGFHDDGSHYDPAHKRIMLANNLDSEGAARNLVHEARHAKDKGSHRDARSVSQKEHVDTMIAEEGRAEADAFAYEREKRLQYVDRGRKRGAPEHTPNAYNVKDASGEYPQGPRVFNPKDERAYWAGYTRAINAGADEATAKQAGVDATAESIRTTVPSGSHGAPSYQKFYERDHDLRNGREPGAGRAEADGGRRRTGTVEMPVVSEHDAPAGSTTPAARKGEAAPTTEMPAKQDGAVDPKALALGIKAAEEAKAKRAARRRAADAGADVTDAQKPRATSDPGDAIAAADKTPVKADAKADTDAQGGDAKKPVGSDGDAAKAPADDKNTAPDADADESNKRRATTQKGGRWLQDKNKAKGGNKPSNHAVDVDLSNIKDGKLDIGYNYNLASITTTMPILGPAGAGNGAGIFLEAGVSAGIKGAASIEVPPDKPGWSTEVKAGLGASGHLAVKGGLQVDAGPVKAEATVAAQATLSANAMAGLRVEGVGDTYKVKGLSSGFTADITASIGLSANLKASVGILEAGHTWHLAGPYTLPILKASYPVEGAPTCELTAEARAFPAKVLAGAKRAKSEIATAAKKAADDGIDAITGAAAERDAVDADEAAANFGSDRAIENWRTIKKKFGVKSHWSYMTKAEREALNSYGMDYIKSYTDYIRYNGSAADAIHRANFKIYRANAQILMVSVRERVKTQKKIHQQQQDLLASERAGARQALAAVAKAHSNMSYHANDVHTKRGVPRTTISPHFDPHNNRYGKYYHATSAKIGAASDAAECQALKAEAAAFAQEMRASTEQIKAL